MTGRRVWAKGTVSPTKRSSAPVKRASSFLQRWLAHTSTGSVPGAADGTFAYLSSLSESQWLAWVMARAREYGWACYHTHDSRKSGAGFPDLVLTRPTGALLGQLTLTGEPMAAVTLVAAELKREHSPSMFTQAQAEWLERFAGVPGCTAYLWMPRHYKTALEVLQ